MSDKPHPGVLKRDAKDEYQELIDVASKILQKLVNFSSVALVRCTSIGRVTGEELEDFAAFSLYHHMMLMLDGIEVLVSQSAIMATKPLIRSLFEAMLSLNYILEYDSKYIDRSLAWAAEYVRVRMSGHARLDPSSGPGKEFGQKLANDKLIRDWLKPDYGQESAAAYQNIKQVLDRPQLAGINQEYERLKKAKNRGKPKWYELFGGPHNIVELANHLNYGAAYDMIYRETSATSHALGDPTYILKTASGQSGVKYLRYPGQIGVVVHLSVSIMLAGTEQFLKHFRPGEDSLSRMYHREIAPLLERIPVKFNISYSDS